MAQTYDELLATLMRVMDERDSLRARAERAERALAAAQVHLRASTQPLTTHGEGLGESR